MLSRPDLLFLCRKPGEHQDGLGLADLSHALRIDIDAIIVQNGLFQQKGLYPERDIGFISLIKLVFLLVLLTPFHFVRLELEVYLVERLAQHGYLPFFRRHVFIVRSVPVILLSSAFQQVKIFEKPQEAIHAERVVVVDRVVAVHLADPLHVRLNLHREINRFSFVFVFVGQRRFAGLAFPATFRGAWRALLLS